MEAITTHENTDFDGLASMLGASKLYPRAVPVLPRRLNRNLRDFLTLYWDELPFVRPQDFRRQRIDKVILVDTQGVPPLRGLHPEAQISIIDHHPLDRELEKEMTYRGGDTGSTTTLLVQEITEARLPLSRVEATLLLLGIYEDTGSLTYPSTTPADVRCAAWLLEQGANLEVVNDFLHQPITEAQQALYQRLLEGAKFHDFQNRSVMIASAQAETYVEEISTLAHKLRDLYDPQALFLLVRMEDRIQLVARSSTDAIDVAEIAGHFDGGGHSKAAAALIEGQDLAAVRERLLQLLAVHVKPTTTVREIMSFGAHTLSPQTTVAQAEEMMRRYGHEGFPVVDRGELVGVLTRREIDRALHHGLHQEPIESYMHKGKISVAPTDSVERLQQVMMEEGVGQVPVVEDGEIVGIVTRTDLIKLWSEPRRASRAKEIAQKMEELLPPNLLAFLKKASKMAKEMGYSLYPVGGFVRDLLLGTPTLDIDLVVEGDAIALARRLAQEVGGRVHGHSRFGTAKLIFSEESPVAPLPSLDFVTARTEFYEHPTALPSVERSSIKQDLHRRDFTINTLAISLDEESYGELLDFYGGEKDIEQGLIRVLHNLSFVEDPTRILRAIRLEQRLGFKVEERTEELIHDALDLLHRVSGERIYQELEAIFREEQPTKALERLQSLEVLSHIHPALRYDDKSGEKIKALPQGLREWKALACRPEEAEPLGVPPEDEPVLYLALLADEAESQEMESLISRLKLRAKEARTLRQVAQLRTLVPQLSKKGLSRSGLYHLLRPYSSQAIFLLWLTTKALKKRLELYHQKLACVEPLLKGQDLKRLGVPPGPIYGQILEALRNARLDGKVRSRKGEKRLVKEFLAAKR